MANVGLSYLTRRDLELAIADRDGITGAQLDALEAEYAALDPHSARTGEIRQMLIDEGLWDADGRSILSEVGETLEHVCAAISRAAYEYGRR